MPPPLIGITGKLPAHGDFVRRGGPPAVLALLDDWLDAELGGAVAAGTSLDDAVDALAGWRFAFDAPGSYGAIAVALASGDKVGRRFPLLAVRTVNAPSALVEAEAWCAAAAAALAAICDDAAADADAAASAISLPAPSIAAALPDAESGDARSAFLPVTGWWRTGDVTATGSGLPRGEAFRALLGEAP